MAGAPNRPWLDLRSNQRGGRSDADGPDEVHRSTIARLELARHAVLEKPLD